MIFFHLYLDPHVSILEWKNHVQIFFPKSVSFQILSIATAIRSRLKMNFFLNKHMKFKYFQNIPTKNWNDFHFEISNRDTNSHERFQNMRQQRIISQLFCQWQKFECVNWVYLASFQSFVLWIALTSKKKSSENGANFWHKESNLPFDNNACICRSFDNHFDDFSFKYVYSINKSSISSKFKI